MKACILLAVTVAFLTCFTACSKETNGIKDGYYTAEAATFDQRGWKEYVTIYISNGHIITVEYDAFNESGFVKSWDVGYMRAMKMKCGTYPTDYARTYAISLIDWQNPDDVDGVTGATHSHETFQKLAAAVVTKAKAGDKQVALVDLSK